MKILSFNGTELTGETIQKTREWYANNSIACIEEVKEGKSWVNDNEAYFKLMNEEAKEFLEGNHDHTVMFLQRAYYIQTGECIALLR